MSAFYHSLRFRLILMFVLTFGAIQVSLSAVALSAREQHLRNYFDDELLLRTQGMAAALLKSQKRFFAPTLAGIVDEESRSLYFREFYVQLRDADGKPVAGSENLGDYHLPFDHRQAATRSSGRGSIHTLTGDQIHALAGEGNSLRMVTLYVDDRGVQPFYLQVATSMEQVNASIALVRVMFAVGTPAGLLIAAVASWFVAGHAVNKINAIADLARQVTPQRLGKRLHVEPADDEIGRMVERLNDMLARIEAGYRAQERFIHDASHELKTPLAALLTEAQVLKLGKPSPEECRRFLDSVEEELRHLGRLVESLLLLTRFDARQQIVDHEVSVHDAVIAAVQECEPIARQYGVELTPMLAESLTDDDEPICRGDEQLVSSMVSNLIRNAIRFSPAGRSVGVDVMRRNGQVVIAVSDEGPGIPPEAMEAIFERYTQLPQNVPRRGSGLGLAIARSVAQLHGGSIHVANRQPCGAVFTVALPCPPRRKPSPT